MDEARQRTTVPSSRPQDVVGLCPDDLQAADLRLHGGPGRIRTCGTRFRKPLLYPLSYGAREEG